MTRTINFGDSEYRTNPWPTYELLRERRVTFVPEGTWDGEDLYIFARYADVNEALRDRDRYSSHIRRGGNLDLPVLVNRDPPDHTRLRKLANTGFHAKLVRDMGEQVQNVIDELVAEISVKDRVEFVEAFASALPLRVVGGMLGIPLDRKTDLRRWSQALKDGFAVAAGMNPALVPGFYEDILEFADYMGELAQQRMGEPNRGDILGALVAEQERGDILREELTTIALEFIVAGHETTTSLLAGAFKALLDDRALAQRLYSAPGDIPEFVDEFARLYSPNQWLLRRARRDIRIDDVDIPEGALIHMLIGSANRDDAQFPDADVLDVDRPNKKDHLAFGAGAHFCPGAVLSRLLADRAIRALCRLRHTFALDPLDPPRLRTRPGSFGYDHMPVLIGGDDPTPDTTTT
ncbi:cytochrome P450 [Nocardia takedensis]|uniref:cytochrome P450 n=1 Tax=Nocardia takedensis TaxID=259390 RepID=UPI003F75D3D3